MSVLFLVLAVVFWLIAAYLQFRIYNRTNPDDPVEVKLVMYFFLILGAISYSIKAFIFSE